MTDRIIQEKEKEITSLKEQIDMLVKDDEEMQKTIIGLRTIIDEATKYIEKHIKYECDATYGGLKFMSYHLYNFKKEDLLKILGGEKND